MSAVPPQRARAKRVTRSAIEIAGGIEAVVAMEGMRGKSQVSRWHAHGEPDLPTLDCVLGLDAVAVAAGHEPPFATFLSHEVGRVLIDPPEATPTQGSLLSRLSLLTAASGELHSDLCAALADGSIDARERDDLLAQIVATQTELTALHGAISQGEN